jgi:hypothetical protein
MAQSHALYASPVNVRALTTISPTMPISYLLSFSFRIYESYTPPLSKINLIAQIMLHPMAANIKNGNISIIAIYLLT